MALARAKYSITRKIFLERMAPMSNTLAPSSVVTNRDPKGSKFMSIVAAAYDKALMSEAEAQRVNDTPGLSDLVTAFIAENRSTNRFKDEEVASGYRYLSGYSKPVGVTQQTNRLRELFPGIGYADEKLIEQPLPLGAEGFFAIPRWEKFAPTYGEAVQKALNMIKQARGKFYNYLEGELGPEYLRQHSKTVAALQKLGEVQSDYNILVVPAQFGLTHRGRSVRCVCECFSGNEFGLGAFAVAIMLLTHPNRLEHLDDLWIDLAGDERNPGADGSFDRAPFFVFVDGKVWLSDKYVGDAHERCGSASGFLSK